MKHTLVYLSVPVLLWFLSANPVYAQYDNYSLKDYVNPDYKRQSLDFNLNGSLSNSSTKQNSSDSYWDSKSQYKAVGLDGETGLGYNRVKNSIRTQNTMYARISYNGLYENQSQSYQIIDLEGNQSDIDYLDKNGISALSLDFDYTGYHYGNNKRFFLFAPEAWFSYNHTNEKLDDETEKSYTSKNSELRTYGSLRLGIGKGRIEEVGDARQAVYILQELQKQGVLKKELSKEEIDELAQLITKLNYKRQFDHRIRLISEITSLDSLLTGKGYIEEERSAAYFTTLYDNWQYAYDSRKSGNRLSFGVDPYLNYSNSKNKKVYFNKDNYTEQDTLERVSYGINLYAAYNSEKPLNLYWQRNFSAEYSVGWYGNDDDPSTDTYLTSLSGGYGLSYYPNSRTSISGWVSQLLYYEFADRRISSQTSLDFQMRYYFSPQLRLNLSYSLRFNYRYTDPKNQDWRNTYRDRYPNNNLSVSLTYSIF